MINPLQVATQGLLSGVNSLTAAVQGFIFKPGGVGGSKRRREYFIILPEEDKQEENKRLLQQKVNEHILTLAI